MLRLCLQGILDNLSSVNDQYRLWGKGTIKIQDPTLFFGAPKSLQIVTAAKKLKDSCSLEEKL